jgi:hypothetical protein
VLQRADITTRDINDRPTGNTDQMVVVSGRSPHLIGPALIVGVHPAYESEPIKSIEHAVDGDNSDSWRDPTRASVYLVRRETVA